MKKGHKLCKHCLNEIAARSLKCKWCEKEQPRPECPEIDWRNLQPGSTINSRRNFGPYHDGPKGRKYMGSYGRFEVLEVLPDGLWAKDNKGTRHFLYMGEDRPGMVGTLSKHGLELPRVKGKKRG